MIGILGNMMEIYPIIEQLRKKYPNIDISITTENISLLEKNHCKIIISLKEIDNPNIILYYRKLKEDEISLNQKELINDIEMGKEEEIRKYLKILNIMKNQIILLDNPLLLYIENIIRESYSNKIINRIEEIIKEIDKVKETKNISFSYNNKIILLKEQ